MTISNERILQLKIQNLDSLIENKAFQFTDKWFPYTSGEIGPYFVQTLAITKKGSSYVLAINSLCELISGTKGLNFDAISGGETRDWDFSNPVAYNLGKPHIKLYKEKESLGADIYGKEIVHIADLSNTGSSMRNYWTSIIRKKGGNISSAFFFVDRLEGADEVLKDLAINSYSVVPLDNWVWEGFLKHGTIDSKIYMSIINYKKDKKEWAHNSLRNNIDYLKYMLNNPLTKTKTEKVLNTGYPEIREELLKKLKI